MTLRLLILLVVLAPAAQAQWQWDAAVEVVAERADNLLRAPDVLLAEGAVLDSVALNDVVLPVGASVAVERAWGPHSVAVRYDLNLVRHHGAGHLNGENHAVRLTARTRPGAVDARVEARWRQAERLGIHVLGEVRPQLFRYTQPEARGQLRWSPSRAHRLTLAAQAYQRAYAAEAPEASPLDHAEAEAGAAWRVRRRESRRTQWSVEASAGVRNRTYGSLRARSAEGDRDDGHPLNRLLYLDAGLDAEVALTPTLSAIAGAAARARSDRFEGYYSYRAATVEAALVWTPRAGVEVEAGGRYRRLGYLLQRAPQEDGPEPLLAYGYLGWSVEASVGAGRGVTLGAYADGTRRHSNVTRQSLLRRRSYGVSAVGLRVGVDLRRAASGAD